MKTPSENRYLLAAAALMILAVIVIVTNRVREEKALAEGGESGRAPAVPGSGTDGYTSGSKLRSTPGVAIRNLSQRKRREGDIVQVSTRRVLATVNGTPIRLAHLVPRSSGAEGELPMERSLFRSRLRRAIETELVFQAALAQGIGLTESQRQRLDQIKPEQDSEVEKLAEYGVTWHSLGDEQLGFKRRMMEAMMLRQNIVKFQDTVTPSTDPAAQAVYESALKKMLTQLENDAEVTIASVGSD